jgi:hypothetical protein
MIKLIVIISIILAAIMLFGPEIIFKLIERVKKYRAHKHYRYRIKILTFKNGRTVYLPQCRERFQWLGIYVNGKTMFGHQFEMETRERALERIDLHYAGNTVEKTIEFEYINAKLRDEKISDLAFDKRERLVKNNR